MPKEIIEMTPEQLDAEKSVAVEEATKGLQDSLDAFNTKLEAMEKTHKELSEKNATETKEQTELQGKALREKEIAEKQKEGVFPNPETTISNVREEKAFPLATIAMAKIKAKREANGKTWLDVLKSEHDKSPSVHTYSAIQYEKSQLGANADAKKYHEFEDKVKTVGLGSTLDGARVNAPGVEAGVISELLPNLAFNQLQGVQRKTLVHGQYEMSVETDSPDGYWGREGASMTSEDFQYDSRRLDAKKAYCFVPITNDRLRFESSILGDMETSMNRKLTKLIDTGYISGLGNADQPLGIYNATGYSADRTSSPTATKIKNDIRNLIVALQNKNVDFTNPAFLGTQAMKTALMVQWDANANLVHYARELQSQSSIMGIPFIASNNASADKLALVDGSELVIADGSGFYVDADSSYGFNSDLTHLRVVTYTDINYLHKTSNSADGVGIITSTSDWITT